ncbi:DUF4352 domain-containing protein [bacterium]|nr:DUF4352 domain-containing protein [bacterium]
MAKATQNNSGEKNWFAKHPILTAIIAIIVIACVGSAASNGSEKESTPSSSTTKNATTAESNNANATNKNKTEETIYNINEPINLKNEIELTVTAINEKNQVGTQYFNSTPAEGGTYVAATWKFKNISDKPIGSFSLPTVKLLSPSGTEYDKDLSASSNYATEIKTDSKVLSDLNPGISVNDSGVFEVSKELLSEPGWKIEIKYSGKKYFVSLP